MFRESDAYPGTLTGAQQGGERRGLPCSFWKSKKCPDFWKKDPDCVHLWVKVFIHNIFLRASRRKNSKIFPCGASFSMRAMYFIRHIQNYGAFSTLFFQVYAGLFSHIKRQWSICTHTETLLRHIQAYSGIFSTICNPFMFTTLSYFEP